MDGNRALQIVRSIASGGMGEVYMAALERHAGFSKDCRIEVHAPELVGKPKFTELFEQEARLAALLSHLISLKSSTSGMKKTGSG